MELWELIARESIRDLVGRYNANGDSGRFDQVMDLFAPGAVMHTPMHGTKVGIDEIRTIFTGARETLAEIGGGTPKYIRHLTATHQIDVLSPTEARGRCYYHVIMEHGLDHWGRYIDRYGVVDGRWMFTERLVTMDGCIPGSWGAQNSARAQNLD
ncbi:nuclear transport factor 2 family protein [Candidatus Poriferisocius sp.]|uniref:nuclear transport factor 2 family protein n=1 Tax=Candidatus Poriferisocius sp. TaxID=3101276 RepID=UPI003B01B532